MCTIDVAPVASTRLREAVFRFRYAVDVEEMQRHEPYADHERSRVSDPLDETGTIFAAIERGGTTILGTVRTNFLQLGDAGAYEHLYGLRDLASERRATTSITTRLMTAVPYRGTTLAVDLVKAAFAGAVAAGTDTDYVDCKSPLVPFFTRLGYRWLRVIDHPACGRANLMRLDVRDRDHLLAVRSPLLPLLPTRDSGLSA